MTDKRISSVSKNYAKAFFDIAKTAEANAQIKIQLKDVLDIINSSNDLRIVMENSSISSSKKKEIIENVFGERFDKRLVNLLKILVDKKRFNKYSEICNAYFDMLDEFENKKNVEVVSSYDLDEETKQKILLKLQAKLNCDVEVEWQKDENIIAGLVFKFDDCIVDTSVAAKLKSLSKNI